MPYRRIAVVFALLTGMLTVAGHSQDTEKKPAELKKKAAEPEWTNLLPAEGLDGWEVTDFGSSGTVTNTDGQLIIEAGDPLNGINYLKKDFPTDEFEIVLKANRLEGNDFLCGLTFPLGKEFCSFIAGGWGGGLVGLSSVDGFDASENSTSVYSDFENNRWYSFKLRVDKEFVTAWIDDEKFFYQERDGHEFSTRIEVYSSQPLGLCAFQSKVAVKDFKWRSLAKTDKKSEGKKIAEGKAESPADGSKAAAPLKGTID